jgi:hypothetical protein
MKPTANQNLISQQSVLRETMLQNKTTYRSFLVVEQRFKHIRTVLLLLLSSSISDMSSSTLMSATTKKLLTSVSFFEVSVVEWTGITGDNDNNSSC